MGGIRCGRARYLQEKGMKRNVVQIIHVGSIGVRSEQRGPEKGRSG